MTLKIAFKLVLGACFTDLYEWRDCFIKCQPWFHRKEWSAAFQLSIPLFQRNATVNSGYAFNKQGDTGYVNFNRSVPSEGGFGVDLTRRFNENSEDLNQARVNYRNSYINTDFGLSGNHDYNYWFGLSGSLIYMAGDLFASNRLGDSFALIDTNQVPDVLVRYENSLIGRSNKKAIFLCHRSHLIIRVNTALTQSTYLQTLQSHKLNNG